VGPGYDPFRTVWWEESGPGSYGRARDFFDSIPAMYDDLEDELNVWRDFIKYMLNGEGGVRRDDPANPFWSSIGLSPRDFDWAEWRQIIETA
jgi:hypothetical protein